MEQITVELYVCGGCGKEHLIREEDAPPHGFHGKVTRVDDSGGRGGEWYACSPRCIRKAVTGASEPT